MASLTSVNCVLIGDLRVCVTTLTGGRVPLRRLWMHKSGMAMRLQVQVRALRQLEGLGHSERRDAARERRRRVVCAVLQRSRADGKKASKPRKRSSTCSGCSSAPGARAQALAAAAQNERRGGALRPALLLVYINSGGGGGALLRGRVRLLRGGHRHWASLASLYSGLASSASACYTGSTFGTATVAATGSR